LGNFSDIVEAGDFNAQHASWGSTTNNFAGCTLCEFLILSSYSVINDGSVTRISANPNLVSCPDITLIKSISLAFSWSVGEDPFGCNYLSIEISISPKGIFSPQECYESKRPKLCLNKLDKSLFMSLIFIYVEVSTKLK